MPPVAARRYAVLCPVIAGYGGVVVEDALRRCLALDRPTPSLSLLHWVVTGSWPDPVVRVDVGFPPPGAAPLL